LHGLAIALPCFLQIPNILGSWEMAKQSPSGSKPKTSSAKAAALKSGATKSGATKSKSIAAKPKPAAADAKSSAAKTATKSKAGSASKPAAAAKGVAAAAQDASATLKHQVEAELADLNAEAKKAGDTSSCQCAVFTAKEGDFVASKSVRRTACQKFSDRHNGVYRVELD
jgi:hypothetical protein